MSVTDHLPDAWTDLADDIRRTRATETVEVWQARATQAEARVAKLEVEAKALAGERGALMRVLAVQTAETMRLRGACEVALSWLGEDRPRAAATALRAVFARQAERPRPEPGTIMDDDQLEELAKAEDHGS